ncbi:hypothetical protein CAEBREN_00651 [Caenorhabditis brenneri]|uniref:Uncharacterized protein n=1 Tax=Caenorhabditis brenneri TaxID=135651 RepID=G0MDK1_CAEBE|nr:hypothetical protein CAEBREN_00651 [Caenorhabditis brenneri]
MGGYTSMLSGTISTSHIKAMKEYNALPAAEQAVWNITRPVNQIGWFELAPYVVISFFGLMAAVMIYLLYATKKMTEELDDEKVPIDD